MDTICNLDAIAKTTTCTIRPSSRCWNPGQEAIIEPHLVYKREGGAYGHFVLCSGHASESAIRKKLMQPTNGFRWIVQDYVPQLKYWGEYRVFIVAGHVLSTVRTRPRLFRNGRDNPLMEIARVKRFDSISQLRCVVISQDAVFTDCSAL